MAKSEFHLEALASQRTLAVLLAQLLLDAERSAAAAIRVAAEMRVAATAERVDAMDELTADELRRLEIEVHAEMGAVDLAVIESARWLAETLQETRARGWPARRLPPWSRDRGDLVNRATSENTGEIIARIHLEIDALKCECGFRPDPSARPSLRVLQGGDEEPPTLDGPPTLRLVVVETPRAPMARARGIVERHARDCPHRADRDARCRCKPAHEAWVWSAKDGRKIRRSFSTPAAAKAWRRDAASAVALGKMRAPTSTTIADEAHAWIVRAERGEVRARGGRPYKPSVLRTYRRDLERYVVPLLGTIRVSQLRRREVQVLLVDDLVGRGLSGSRIRGVLNALRAVLRRPLQADELQADPTDRLDLPAGDRARDRAASPSEAAALLAALPDEDRALWATAFYAGLRRGELRALRWGDVDDAVSEIRVSRGWDDEEGEIAPKSEKGVRRVPVAASLRLVLLEHKARTGRRDDDLVFGRTAREPVHAVERPQARPRRVGRLRGRRVPPRRAVELEPIGLHECRHTFVSLMHAAGRSLEEIGDYVGHRPRT